MLSQLPTPARLPQLSLILNDIGSPSPTALAVALDVPARLTAAWLRADSAPRAVTLALFWLTRWGRSQLDAHMVNEIRQLAGLVDCLQRDRQRDAARFARVLQLGDFGSANAPAFDHAATRRTAPTAAPAPAPVSTSTPRAAC